MGRKIRMNEHIGQTVAEVYQDFILAKTAEGVSDVTIRNYHQHLHNISKYLDIEQPMAALSKRDLESMVCEMRAAGLAHNSISTYVRVGCEQRKGYGQAMPCMAFCLPTSNKSITYSMILSVFGADSISR